MLLCLLFRNVRIGAGVYDLGIHWWKLNLWARHVGVGISRKGTRKKGIRGRRNELVKRRKIQKYGNNATVIAREMLSIHVPAPYAPLPAAMWMSTPYSMPSCLCPAYAPDHRLRNWTTMSILPLRFHSLHRSLSSFLLLRLVAVCLTVSQITAATCRHGFGGDDQ